MISQPVCASGVKVVSFDDEYIVGGILGEAVGDASQDPSKSAHADVAYDDHLGLVAIDVDA